MNATLITLTARALLGRRRVWLLVPIPVLLLGMALLGMLSPVPAEDWSPGLLSGLGIAVLLPLTALIVGSSALGLEIEDGTITHILTKPVPRYEIIIAKLIVAWGVTVLAAALPIGLAAVIVAGTAAGLGVFIACVVGALAYTAIFLALSLVTRRPVAFGLVYIMLWENLLTRFVDGARILSIKDYVTAIGQRLAGSGLLEPATLAPLTGVILAVLIASAATVAATARLRAFALTGETA